MKSLNSWSLKSRVTWSFMIVVFCVSVVISFLYFFTQRRMFEENLVRTDENDIVYLMGNVDKQFILCEKLSDWIYVNRRVETALIRDYSEDMGRFDRDIPAIQRTIIDQLNSSSIGKYVVFLYIRGDNGITLKSSNPDADWVGDLESYDWHSIGIAANGKVVWPGIFKNPAVYQTSGYIIPVTRPVIFADTREKIGWYTLAFNPALISDVFEDYHMDENRSIILFDENYRIVFHQDQNMTGGALDEELIQKVGRSPEGSSFVTLGGRHYSITLRKSGRSGMTMLLLHSLRGLDRQANFVLIMLVIIFLLTVIMFFILTSYLSNRLTKPLGAILGRLREVSTGIFAQDDSITGDDEMGQIGRGVNEMAGRIGALMEELIRREHEKSQLEYRVLLNQINPHFIYNVLNSIKMMADIQKIEGISSMASSLGTLLKEISKGTAEQIPIRRELELLDKYLYIQRIRRNGLLVVQYDIESEDLQNCLIPRFTLQPLAENAVSHGLDRVDRVGNITVSIRSEGEDVIILLEDNGAGIPEEKIKTLLSGEQDQGKDISHVGLINVDKRIKLFFGCGGLSLESREGEYTRVYVRFPKKEM
ncbi:histidine kinase [Spirochaetia bacterium]|nr:histidine kinase [Spirochaetia bacterium]